MKEKLTQLLQEGKDRIDAVRSEAELQEVKALLLGNGAKPPQREASARSKVGGAVRLWFRCRAEVQPAQIDDCAVVALIGKQRVGAVAQKVGAHTVFPAKRQRAAQLVHGFSASTRIPPGRRF